MTHRHLFLVPLVLACVAFAGADDGPAPSPARLSIGAQRRLRIAATVTSGWMWFRAALLLFFGPPLALLLWSIYRDPGTPIVLRMLHARALELLGFEPPAAAELARALREDARRVRRWELGVQAPGTAPPGGAERGPAAAAGENGGGLRARPAGTGGSGGPSAS